MKKTAFSRVVFCLSAAVFVYVVAYLIVRHKYKHEIRAVVDGRKIGSPEHYVRFRSARIHERALYYLFSPLSDVDMAISGRSLYLDDYRDDPSGHSELKY